MNTPFISYAQNAEDVVLWRVLQHVEGGRYVDVGAADPVEYSVTRAFYEAGWRGVSVEPVPMYADALRRHRPGDVVIQKAAGAVAGLLTLNVADGTGLSTMSSEVANRVGRDGHSFHQIDVEVAPLDQILEEAGMTDVDIHFLKVDVEGFEAEVLSGLSLERWRPWVLVVEATEPLSEERSHDRWEARVLSAGYTFCLFDGLNRFYASPQHPEFADRLSYPACVFDHPFQRAEASLAVERSRGESVAQIAQLRAEVARQHADGLALLAEVRREADARNAMVTRAEEYERRCNYLSQLVGGLRSQSLTLRGGLTEALLRIPQLELELAEACGERDGYHQRLIDLSDEFSGMKRTAAWRMTGPLRKVRRLTLTPTPEALRDVAVSPVPESNPDDLAGPASLVSGLEWQSSSDARVRARVAGFSLRIAQATCLLRGEPVPATAGEIPLVEEFAEALVTSPEPPSRLAWLALVVSDARYPTEGELQKAIRSLRTAGSDALAAEVVRRFEIALGEMRAPEVGLDVRRNVVLVDITHTASHDLHTGIQRVVRQVCARWFVKAEVVPVYWNHAEGVLRALAPSERERMMRWAEHMHEGGSAFGGRLPEEDTGAPIVPWGSRLIIPELSAEAPRCDGYRALAISAVLSGLSYLAYDLIPISAPETVAEGMPGAFANYLSNVKYADRLSAISDASAIDYRAFTTALASQGLRGPKVAAHLLPVDDPLVDPLELVSLDAELGLADAPLVLVVGSHEPRKNHLVVLDAAEELWGRGHWFHLVFMGGSGWRDEGFNSEVDRLRSLGLPVRVLKRVSEGQLWAGYARARFTIFPSIVEGFGLPIVESLRCGTPVITSNYGSMAEVAVGGGAVLVDPREPKDLVKAMEELLNSGAVLEALEKEAMARRWKTWDEYADEVWAHLAPESTGSNTAEPKASSV